MCSCLRDKVFDALSNAVENGYGEFIMNSPLEEVAYNLIDYDADLDSEDFDLIVPEIQIWRDIHKV